MKTLFNKKQELESTINTIDDIIKLVDSYDNHIRQVGKLAKIARVSNGLSQLDLAQAIGARSSYIGLIENGLASDIPIEILADIAAYLENYLETKGEKQ